MWRSAVGGAWGSAGGVEGREGEEPLQESDMGEKKCDQGTPQLPLVKESELLDGGQPLLGDSKLLGGGEVGKGRIAWPPMGEFEL